MKYLTLVSLSLIIICSACESSESTDAITPTDEVIYIEDNIFDCDQYEVMETENQFTSNTPPPLEVFNDFFVYEAGKELVVRDGFNGPILQTREMQVQDLVVFNQQLMICAEEGVYSLKENGDISTITEERCYSMTLDGQNRLMLQGVFGNGQFASSYAIHEFKNNTLVPFTDSPGFFECVSIDLIGGDDQSLYAVSCFNEIAHYKNGVIRAQLDNEEFPLFIPSGGQVLYESYDDDLIVMVQENTSFYKMYKLVDQSWKAIYDLDYEDVDKSVKRSEVFVYIKNNIFIHNDYLYTFWVGGPQTRVGISRFDLSGDEQKSWEDIDMITIPGLEVRDIIDIVIASDGHAYAVLNSRKIVRISC